MRCILDGYLTKGCKNCPDWCDGSDPEKGYGCGTHYPIDWCPHFAKMMEEDNKRYRRTEAMRKAINTYPSKNNNKEYVLYDDSGLGIYYADGGVVCFPVQAEKFTIDEALVVSRRESCDGHHWKVVRVDF